MLNYFRIKFSEGHKTNLPLSLNRSTGVLSTAKDPELDRGNVTKENIYELEDLLPMYPDQDTPNIQTYVSSKQEFREVGAPAVEPLPARGEFLNHQEFTHRYMYHYPRFFIMSKPGTGKTGAAGGFVEKIKHNLKINQNLNFIDAFFNKNRSSIRQIVILVSNPLLKAEFENQLIYRYSAPGDYDINSLNVRQLSSKRRIIGRMLGPMYKIKTYSRFSAEILSLGPPEVSDKKIKELYSFTAFVCDESHNVGVESIEGLIQTKLTKNKTRSKALTYGSIKRVFHIAIGCKYIMMSATPMTNDASEIIDIFNLNLPPDNQIPSSKEDRRRFLEMPLKELEPYYRGKISYVRESGIPIVKEYVGEYLQQVNGEPYQYYIGGKYYKTDQVLYALPMIDEVRDQDGNILDVITQGQVYRANAGSINIAAQRLTPEDIEAEVLIEETEEDVPSETEDPKGSSDPKRNFFKNAGKLRQICDAIFPDGSAGSEGFNKYIILNENTGEYEATPELREAVEDMNHLKRLSIKYSTIIEILQNFESSPIRGPAYTYTHFKVGSGAIYFGLCMEAHGYQKFKGDISPFKVPVVMNINPSCTPITEEQFCTPEETKKSNDDLELDENFLPKRRYAILTSNTSDTQRNNIMALYSSTANIDGDYLQFLIITPIGREGISLSDTMKFFLTDPNWNPSSPFQAESRGFRENSHREKIKQYQKLMGDPNARLPIEVYNMCAYDKKTSDSVDVQLYKLSEQKNIEIKLEERNMKIVAVDEYINRDRNHRRIEGARDYSSQCDYSPCEYGMYDPEPPPGYIDYSTYDILYSDTVVDKIMGEIKEVFRKRYNIFLYDLISLLKDYRHGLVLLAVTKMIINKTKLIDRFGIICYLLEDQGTLFIQNEFPIVSINNFQLHYNLNYYTSLLIVSEDKRLEDYTSERQSVEQSGIIKNIYNLTDVEQIKNILESLSLDNKVKVIEEAIIDASIGNVAVNAILKIHLKSWFKIRDPVKDIVIASQNLSKSGNGKGRPGRRPKEAAKIFNPTISPYRAKLPESNEEGSEIFIHILYGDLLVKATLSVTPDYLKAEGVIRVYKPHEGIWRDANEAESVVYKNIISSKRKEVIQELKDKGIYGTLLADGKFRISYNKPGEVHEDGRKVKNGRHCKSMNVTVLSEIMYTLGIPINFALAIQTDSIANMQNFLLSQGFQPDRLTDLRELVYYYKLNRSGTKIANLCSKIREHMEKNNLIYYG